MEEAEFRICRAFTGPISIIAPEKQLGVEETKCLMTVGVQQIMTVLYKQFGGNKLFFYNEKLQPILDSWALYHAGCVIFTNQERMPNEPLEGVVLMEGAVCLIGTPTIRNRVVLSCAGNKHILKDEYSFLVCTEKTNAFVGDVEARIE